MPDKPLYNLIWFLPWAARHNLTKLTPLLQNDLMGFLKDKHGATKFAAMTFCWGVAVGAQLSTMDGAFVCEVNTLFTNVMCLGCVGHFGCHPSFNVFGVSYGPSQASVLGAIKCKQAYVAGKADVMTPECDAHKLIRDVAKVEVSLKVYQDQTHGWVNRGDVSVPAVQADVERALNEAEAFFKSCFE
jgi:dienelactone hydrolase